jgi:hypothetical protein
VAGICCFSFLVPDTEEPFPDNTGRESRTFNHGFDQPIQCQFIAVMFMVPKEQSSSGLATKEI